MGQSKLKRKLNSALIVSDDEDLSLLLSFLLEAEAVQVRSSRILELAIPGLAKEQPNAIFLDLEDGSSWRLLEFIQKRWPHIALFTVAKPEFRALAERSMQAGAQGYLLTPVDYRGVQRILGSRVGERKQNRNSHRSGGSFVMTR